MTFLKNLYAWFVIGRSNFVADFGGIITFTFFAFIFVCLAAGFFRTLMAGRHLKRSSPLKLYSPDPDLAQHAAESLCQAIRIPTVTGSREEIDRFRDFLKERYPDLFEHFTLIPTGSQSLILRWRGPKDSKKLPMLYCGHMDVVPPGNGWGDEDPFSGSIDDKGFIRGRGAIDCKNVVIGLLEAAHSLLEEGFEPDKDIYFAFGHDEEIGGAEGAFKMAELFEKRGIKFEAVVDEGGYITEEHFGRKRFPAALIGIAEKGCTYYKLTATGKAGHSSVPPRHTAVGILAEAICRIEAAPPRARLLDPVDINMKMSAPAMRFIHRFTVCNLPFSMPLLFKVFRNVPTVNPFFRTTFACTQVQGSDAPNVMPEKATCTVNARILQGDTPKSIKKHIESLVDDLPVEVESVLEMPASPITPTDSAVYKRLCSILDEQYPGLPCIPGIQPITTDSRHYKNVSDNIFRFMPFVMNAELYERMHNSEERLSVNSFGLAVESYKRLIKGL